MSSANSSLLPDSENVNPNSAVVVSEKSPSVPVNSSALPILQVSDPTILGGGGDVSNFVAQNPSVHFSNSNSELIHGGGVPAPSAILASNVNSTISGATFSLPSIAGGSSGPLDRLNSASSSARTVFSFTNPFAGSAPSPRSVQQPGLIGSSGSQANVLAASPSNAAAASSDSQPARDRFVVEARSDQQFSKMTAVDLSQVVKGKIQVLDTRIWIEENITGASILEIVRPHLLSNFLTTVVKIPSAYLRCQVENIIYDLIEKDTFISSQLREAWRAAMKAAIDAEPAVAAAHTSPAPSADVSRALFHSPANTSPAGISTPAFFASPHVQRSLGGGATVMSAQASSPSFMREMPSRLEFPIHQSSGFGREPTRPNASFDGPNSSMSASPNGNLHITIHQAAVTPPAYLILETCSNLPEFYKWLRKNRNENLLARDVDRKLLNQLCSKEVMEEVTRILVGIKRCNLGGYFDDANCPYPTSWVAVTDELFLKVLFGIHGPRSALDAKDRLEARAFFFNDSTTSQALFTAKLRKFFYEFKSSLADFAFNSHQWIDEELTRDMIREALSRCFSSKEMIKGPVGTLVPKCHHLTLICDLIRQKKSLPIEEIMNHIVDHYERNDVHIRSHKGATYDVKPWVTPPQKNKLKRNANQLVATTGLKPPRPPATHPRCSNCGSKMHLNDERNCYLWGHPKGLGASGVWPDGTPSLRLTKPEWDDWGKTRHSIFYGYPENQTRTNPAKRAR